MNGYAMEVVDNLINLTLTNGGCTLSRYTGIAVNPIGYAVAIRNASLTIPAEKLHEHRELIAYFLSTRYMEHIGSWVDENGLVWIEETNHIYSLSEAIELGLHREQSFIYDLFSQRAIPLTDYSVNVT